jgi:serine/threonine protein kinase
MRDGQLPSEYVRNLTETHSDENSSASSYRRAREGANQLRHRRRAEHNQAVIDDLCEVVADLFVAESKLLKPVNYGVLEDATSCNSQRERIVTSTRNFLAALPTRYALGADTPSEVLLHMRLMAAARSDKSKAAVHIHNLEDDGNWGRTVVAASAKHQKLLRLVTISCNDATGLLELITRNLATGGSRVMDADVMLSTDGIVLDRFVVEMNGRLRLDKMVDLIETFLRENIVSVEEQSEPFVSTGSGSADGLPAKEPSGPLYYKSAEVPQELTPRDFHKEMETAVPLLEVLASSASGHLLAPDFPKLRRLHSMPNPLSTVLNRGIPNLSLTMRSPALDGVSISSSPVNTLHNVRLPSVELDRQGSMRERRPLVNRRGSSDLDRFGEETTAAVPLDYVTVSNTDTHLGEGRDIPLIPFEELMLIETIGTGRVSTIYRAAWQNSGDTLMPSSVNMVALKVAMVDPSTGDTSHIDEVRREADIAARLHHPNICDLVGVAADLECFCLAYDFCEGGSLLSLLTDSRRYYEYLPIALDVANGMAYLHNRNVIHRDLKPSNILLTRDHRAKIADFGMSVANAGQELTAETGTYRYMAPEVIRHESYSSNADVYSFGVCLWQLITREIPFATMTPIQAAYAVAEGRRPEIPSTTPRRLQEIIMACWDQDSHRRPSFTYIAMALADYAKMAFSPANVGALTLQIANEMLANVEGNSTVNVDFTTPVASSPSPFYMGSGSFQDSVHGSTVGLEIE